jgi:hypothetical protein
MFYFLIVTLFFSCNNYAQKQYVFDKIPLDTTKWCVTDTFIIDFNKDGINDVVLVFDKYRALTRPDNIQTPVLFYLGTKSKNFTFIKKAEKIIFLPYELEVMDNDILLIRQKGIKNDRNIYTNLYKFENNSIFLIKEIAVEKITKSVIDENTGDVITKTVEIDTLINRTIKISVDQYDFRSLYQKFMNE